MQVFILPAAGADIETIYRYIASEHLGAADRFLEATAATIDRLRRAPELGRRRRFRIAGLAGLRSLHVTGFRNYIIYHRVTDVIHIVRVLHASRDSSRTLRRRP